MADEADPGNVLAVKNVGFRAAYRPAPHTACDNLEVLNAIPGDLLGLEHVSLPYP